MTVAHINFYCRLYVNYVSLCGVSVDIVHIVRQRYLQRFPEGMASPFSSEGEIITNHNSFTNIIILIILI